MTNIGVISENGDTPTSEQQRILKACGCKKVVSLSMDQLPALLLQLQAGDRITLTNLSELQARSNDLLDFLAEAHGRNIEIATSDDLLLPVGKAGDAILEWLVAVEQMRSRAQSRAVKTALSRAPSKRKLSDSDREAFLVDAQKMTQGQLADTWDISLATAKNYLKRWG
jgi:hypothetical protein